jgi:uncharacterized membrane protein
MARAVYHKLGSDLRFKVAYVLLAIAISLVVVLVTGSLGTGGLVASALAFVSAGAKYQHEQASLSR